METVNIRPVVQRQSKHGTYLLGLGLTPRGVDVPYALANALLHILHEYGFV